MIKYDSVGDSYVTMAAMPAARANFAAATVGSAAYVIGGFASSGAASEDDPQVSLTAAGLAFQCLGLGFRAFLWARIS